jgi:hypothetical protein
MPPEMFATVPFKRDAMVVDPVTTPYKIDVMLGNVRNVAALLTTRGLLSDEIA